MITAYGSLGTSNDKSTGRTCTMSPSRAVAAGRFLVVFYANDSIYNVADDTDGSNFFRCVDSQGNIWSTIGSVTDKRGFFRDGPLAQLYGCQLRYALATSDTITVESGNHDPGSVWAKAMSVQEFDLGTGMRWCVPSDIWQSTFTAAADPPAISRTTEGVLRENLFLHCLGAEGPNTDTYTWDTDYTEIAGDGTTGGAVDSNIHVRGGYRIAELLSDTVDVTSDTADRDYVQTMNIVSAVPRRLGFPNTPILDNFNRANENPLDNGNWLTTDYAYYGAAARLISNQAAGAGGSFWNEQFTNCGEAYFDIPVFEGLAIHFYAGGASEAANMVGSGATWALRQGAMGHCINFGRSGNQGDFGAPVAFAHINGANGYKIGLQRLKSTSIIGSSGIVDHLWVDRGAGWEEVVARLHLFGAFSPATGMAAIAFHGTTGRGDNFGAGEIPCNIFKPQIYRRQFGVA